MHVALPLPDRLEQRESSEAELWIKMSLTMQNIISDAQTLCTQLKDHESLADHLISQAQCLYKQVDAMKQYEEEVGQLNEVAHQKPRDALVQVIQQENRHLRELQQENKELRNSLEEHQNTLEIVMSNYRKQVTQLMEINKSDRQLQLQQQRRGGQAGAATCQQSPDTALLQLQSDKIQEMALVMRRAVELDEQSEHRAQETIAQLNRENKGLRELLRVIYSYNSDRLPPPGHPSPQMSAPVDPESPVSLPDSPCSQTARRPPSADSTSSGSEGHFQTVRRRTAAKGAADSPASPEGKTAPGVGSPGDVKVPPVPTSAPPKVPALAARSPTTVKAAAVTVRPPAPSGPAPTPAAAPAQQGTVESSLSPNKAAVPPPTKQSPEKQSSPQKAETSPTQQPASAAGSPQTATSPSPSE